MLEGMALLDHVMHRPFWKEYISLCCKDSKPVFLKDTFHYRLLSGRTFSLMAARIHFSPKIYENTI